MLILFALFLLELATKDMVVYSGIGVIIILCYIIYATIVLGNDDDDDDDDDGSEATNYIERYK